MAGTPDGYINTGSCRGSHRPRTAAQSLSLVRQSLVSLTGPPQTTAHSLDYPTLLPLMKLHLGLLAAACIGPAVATPQTAEPPSLERRQWYGKWESDSYKQFKPWCSYYRVSDEHCAASWQLCAAHTLTAAECGDATARCVSPHGSNQTPRYLDCILEKRRDVFERVLKRVCRDKGSDAQTACRSFVRNWTWNNRFRNTGSSSENPKWSSPAGQELFEKANREFQDLWERCMNVTELDSAQCTRIVTDDSCRGQAECIGRSIDSHERKTWARNSAVKNLCFAMKSPMTDCDGVSYQGMANILSASPVRLVLAEEQQR